MKQLILFLTFILFLYGVLLFSVAIRFGSGFYTLLLTITTLLGFVTLLINWKRGLTIIFIASIFWLLLYFESLFFLLLYDDQNIGRWIIVGITILISISIFILVYKSHQESVGEHIKIRFVSISILIIIMLGLISFIHKSHVHEFNCWYYFDMNNKEFRITFANSPDHIFETYSNSEELKNLIMKYGIKDTGREGIYCPETKVKVVTRFKEIVSAEILGFRNSNSKYKANLDEPFEIDLNKINGDREMLEPDFKLN